MAECIYTYTYTANSHLVRCKWILFQFPHLAMKKENKNLTCKKMTTKEKNMKEFIVEVPFVATKPS